MGRFIQGDAIIPDVYSSQSLDPFAYVVNNPFNFTDPLGFDGVFSLSSGTFGGSSGGFSIGTVGALGLNSMPSLSWEITPVFSAPQVVNTFISSAGSPLPVPYTIPGHFTGQFSVSQYGDRFPVIQPPGVFTLTMQNIWNGFSEDEMLNLKFVGVVAMTLAPEMIPELFASEAVVAEEVTRAAAVARLDRAQMRAVERLKKWTSLKSQKQVTTVVSGVNVETGQLVTRLKIDSVYNGVCAEDLVAEVLGRDSNKVIFSKAVGYRAAQGGFVNVPVCFRCQVLNPPILFQPGIVGKEGGIWFLGQ